MLYYTNPTKPNPSNKPGIHSLARSFEHTLRITPIYAARNRPPCFLSRKSRLQKNVYSNNAPYPVLSYVKVTPNSLRVSNRIHAQLLSPRYRMCVGRVRVIMHRRYFGSGPTCQVLAGASERGARLRDDDVLPLLPGWMSV